MSEIHRSQIVEQLFTPFKLFAKFLKSPTKIYLEALKPESNARSIAFLIWLGITEFTVYSVTFPSSLEGTSFGESIGILSIPILSEFRIFIQLILILIVIQPVLSFLAKRTEVSDSGVKATSCILYVAALLSTIKILVGGISNLLIGAGEDMDRILIAFGLFNIMNVIIGITGIMLYYINLRKIFSDMRRGSFVGFFLLLFVAMAVLSLFWNLVYTALAHA